MKKMFRFFVFVICIAMLYSCPVEEQQEKKTEQHQQYDWLLMWYLDADNNLNDAYVRNMINMEKALTALQSSPLKHASVKVVALWDGYPDKYVYNIPDSYLLEVGERQPNESIVSFCAKTKNVSATAGQWFNYNKETDSGEVNMGDYHTLSNFIKWAKKRYNAKNNILVVNNHGSGLASPKEKDTGRSVCSDSTSYEEGLSDEIGSKQLDIALNDGGVHFDIICFDTCLTANIEEMYQIKDCADYVIASPNISCSGCFDWEGILTNVFYKNTDSTKVAKGILKYLKLGTINNVTVNPIEERDALSDDATYAQTWSLFDMTKFDNLFDSINDFSQYLIDDFKGSNKVAQYLTDDEHSLLVHKNIYGVKDINDTTLDKTSIGYEGSFTFNFDIGYLVTKYRMIVDPTADPSLKDFYLICNDVISNLESAIVDSWRRFPNPNYGVESYYDVMCNGNKALGLTIVGGALLERGIGRYLSKNLKVHPDYYFNYIDFYPYKEASTFGAKSKWSDLLDLILKM